MILDFRKELEEEEAQREEMERNGGLRSVTSKDFGIDDFVPQQPEPTAVSEHIIFHMDKLDTGLHQCGVSSNITTYYHRMLFQFV